MSVTPSSPLFLPFLKNVFLKQIQFNTKGTIKVTKIDKNVKLKHQLKFEKQRYGIQVSMMYCILSNAAICFAPQYLKHFSNVLRVSPNVSILIPV